MARLRLDQRVHALGLTESREQARRLIMAGEVLVNGQIVDRPAANVEAEAEIVLKSRPRFVSRGGEKLDAALEHFGIDVRGLVCADVGASTGGFTDCLLQRGAAKVYAIDVGHGLLDYRLRTDPRVVVMEDTNARHLERLPEMVQFISMDAAFISLKTLLPVVRGWTSPPTPALRARVGGEVIALIKPQFEAGRTEVSKGGGVIRDARVHRRVLAEVLAFAIEQGFAVRGLIPSPLRGPKGNTEFLAWLQWPASASAVQGDVEEMIAAAMASPS
jgi:23S rRNA (cytidine1920-2'-O)/16S rRNA (cytidine1409-2'-O)-methyltransferase